MLQCTLFVMYTSAIFNFDDYVGVYIRSNFFLVSYSMNYKVPSGACRTGIP